MSEHEIKYSTKWYLINLKARIWFGIFASDLSVIYYNTILLYARAVGTTLTAVDTKQLFMRPHCTQQWLVSFPLIIKRNCHARSLFTELCLYYTRGHAAQSVCTLQAKRRNNTLLTSPEDIGNGKKLLKSFLGKIETERRRKFENLWAVNLGKHIIWFCIPVVLGNQIV